MTQLVLHLAITGCALMDLNRDNGSHSIERRMLASKDDNVQDAFAFMEIKVDTPMVSVKEP